MNGISLETTNVDGQFKLTIRGEITILDKSEVEGLCELVNAFVRPNKPYFERSNSIMKNRG